MKAIGAGAVLLLMVGAMGCSNGGSSSAAPATCANVSGLYSYVFSNTWTNDPAVCPLPMPFETVLGGAAARPANCSDSVSGTACSASLQRTCSVTVQGFSGTSVMISVGDTDPSGGKITGSVQLQVTYDNGQGQCNAAWDFVATREHP